MILFVMIAFGYGQLAKAEDLLEPAEPPHLLADVTAGTVLSAEKPHVRWAPASLTKMMTAYTAFRALELQHLKLNSPIRISEYALSQPPSKMGYPVGTVLTLETAIKIIMVKSANDLSVAIAEGVAGSEEQFVALMNSHARRLGMRDTQFRNPHGLHDPDQYTSAWDMLTLTKAVTSEFPQYASYFNINRLRVAGRVLRNHNALLRLFEGTSGMKTGYVCASGFNVVVRTERKNRKLVAVVFGGRSGLARNVKTARLLTEGFSGAFKEVAIPFEKFSNGDGVSNIPEDITRQTCPRKYAARGKPGIRPAEAPVSDDFDAIDTQILIDQETAKKEQTAEKEPSSVTLVPTKRPEYVASKTVVSAKASASVSIAADASGEESKVEEQKEPALSLRELAQIYLVPHQDLRPAISLKLGGATGPNPFRIKHTNGGPYKAPIPVPEKRPALDLATTEE